MAHIIPRFSPSGQTPWQNQLANAVREPVELLERLQLPKTLLPAAQKAHAQFPLRVPQAFIEKITPGDPLDPLLLQVLPHHLELVDHPQFVSDPVGDHAAEQAPGVIQKYHGRALLISTGACAVHCRYCFRRHYPYSDSQAGRDNWQTSLDYLRQHEDLQEVILSGGDPLSLSDSRLAALSTQLNQIEHLRYLRIHTRLPVVIPARVEPALLTWLQNSRLKPVVVLHINHPQEIDGALQQACQQLKQSGCELLNQAVLLKGINDQTDTLASLSRKLFDSGILPYYLHSLDRVAGAAHFEVPHAQALQLVEKLRQILPGYLVPRLVQEIAGQAYKTPLLAD